MRLVSKGVLSALWGFFRREAAPRASDILWTQDTLLAVAIGIIFAAWGPGHLTRAPKASDLATAFVAYAAIALGFCVGGMTVALTLPDRDFVTKLAGVELKNRSGNALSGLLFVFTWTAVVHWAAIAAMLLFMLIDGGNAQSFVAGAGVRRRIFDGGIAALCSYALLQFLITVLTLAHVASLYISALKGASRAATMDEPDRATENGGSKQPEVPPGMAK